MTISDIIRSITGAPPPAAPPPVATVDDGPMTPLQRDVLTADEFVVLAESAQLGDAEAQRKLGLIYYRGLGVEIDRAEAFKWLTLSADQGNLEAMQVRGLVIGGLDSGVLFESRCRVARFRGESEPEHSPVQVEAVPRDNVFTTDATLTWERPVEPGDVTGEAMGSPEGTMAPAMPEASGPAVFINPGTLVAEPGAPAVNPAVWWWFWGIVLVGAAAVATTLSFLPARSSSQVAFEPSPIPFRPAAIPGSMAGAAGSEVNLDGALLMANFSELLGMAERGNVRAQYLTGLALSKGDGVEKDVAKAAAWYAQAAERGDRDAQNNLGVFYIQGTGVEKDVVEAYKWFAIASDSGIRGAARNREQLAMMMNGEQIKEGSRRAAAFSLRKRGSP